MILLWPLWFSKMRLKVDPEIQWIKKDLKRRYLLLKPSTNRLAWKTTKISPGHKNSSKRKHRSIRHTMAAIIRLMLKDYSFKMFKKWLSILQVQAVHKWWGHKHCSNQNNKKVRHATSTKFSHNRSTWTNWQIKIKLD